MSAGSLLARAAAVGVRGWSVDRVLAAGRRAADLLAPQVGAYVPSLLAEHRRAGHVLVLATTTPDALIRPLARRLGFDEVIGTRYAWKDGAYSGALEGGFVWGPGKLAAVRRWARDEQMELRESFAYSDSVFDLPLLSAVGHPVATNPDPALHAFALLRRWPVLHLDSPPGVVTVLGAEAFDLAKHAIRPEMFPYARFDIEGVDQIPDAGPFVLVRITAATSTWPPSPSSSLERVGERGSSPRRSCSTHLSWARSPAPSAGSRSSAAERQQTRWPPPSACSPPARGLSSCRRAPSRGDGPSSTLCCVARRAPRDSQRARAPRSFRSLSGTQKPYGRGHPAFPTSLGCCFLLRSACASGRLWKASACAEGREARHRDDHGGDLCPAARRGPSRPRPDRGGAAADVPGRSTRRRGHPRFEPALGPSPAPTSQAVTARGA